MAEVIGGGQTRGELWHYVEFVIAERKDCNLRSWSLADRETQSQSIVVSAWEWLVVNPSGVTEPTVGWKRARLSVVAPTSGGISDKYLTYCILKFIY
jgi:hypothetical protein